MGQAVLLTRKKAIAVLWVVAALAAGCGGASTAPASAGATLTPADVERLKTLVPRNPTPCPTWGFTGPTCGLPGSRATGLSPSSTSTRRGSTYNGRFKFVRSERISDGRDVDLQAIFQAVDASTFAAVKIAIEQKNRAQFATAYKGALDGCYSCHKSSGKPYLHPIVPTAPAQTIIDFNPGSVTAQ